MLSVISLLKTTEPRDCSTFLQNLEYVDAGRATGYHHATQGDALGIKPLSAFCARQKGIMGLLLDILDNSPEDAAILRRWAAS